MHHAVTGGYDNLLVLRINAANFCLLQGKREQPGSYVEEKFGRMPVGQRQNGRHSRERDDTTQRLAGDVGLFADAARTQRL